MEVTGLIGGERSRGYSSLMDLGYIDLNRNDDLVRVIESSY